MAKTQKIKVPAFKSGFAILDVTTGRKALLKHVENTGTVRATIDVVIQFQHSRDDGTSMEFACDVEQIKNIRAV